MHKYLIILFFVACNPVKKVLNNPEKFNQVKDEVIKRGYCANDTTLIFKSDTTYIIDSLIEIYTDTTIVNDTIYITKWNNRNFTNTFLIHDTIKSFVVDHARNNILIKENDRLSIKLNHFKSQAQTRLNWLIIACLLIVIIILYKFK